MNTQIGKAREIANEFLNLPVEETEFSPLVIMHPYFESAFLNDKDGIFNLLDDNERYKLYIKQFYIDRIIECETVSDILYLVRKSYKLTFLKFLRDRNIISVKECGNLLAEVWDAIEIINHDVNVPKRQVLQWILKADKDVLMDKEELQVYTSLSDEITIYRGCESKKGMLGISWSIDKNKAKWFSQRFVKDGLLYKANIKKSDVIGYLANRGEKEIIVDYRKLYNIELM